MPKKLYKPIKTHSDSLVECYAKESGGVQPVASPQRSQNNLQQQGAGGSTSSGKKSNNTSTNNNTLFGNILKDIMSRDNGKSNIQQR